MPSDLRNAIIAAIAGEADPNTKRILMLMLRVEEIFIAKIDALSEQLTVPADQHAEDHRWIMSHRKGEGSLKAAVWKITVGLIEKGTLVAAGALASRLMGVL